MITIIIKKTEKWQRDVSTGGEKKIIEDEREVEVYSQRLDDNVDIEAIIAAANAGLQKKPKEVKIN